jgi:hypothetical protein
VVAHRLYVPQVQDMVPLLVEAPTPLSIARDGASPSSPAHGNAALLLAMLDVDGDGAASRKDMLLAFRRDRQLAGGSILCGGCPGVWTTNITTLCRHCLHRVCYCVCQADIDNLCSNFLRPVFTGAWLLSR